LRKFRAVYKEMGDSRLEENIDAETLSDALHIARRRAKENFWTLVVVEEK